MGTYLDEVFVLTMPGSSVVLDTYLGSSGGGDLYGPADEEAFLRVVFERANNRWVVTDKGGVTYTFGAGPVASRSGPSVNAASGTFSWGLTEIKDPSSNTVSVTYAAFGVSGTSNAFLYPSAVDYGDNTLVGSITHLFHVCFGYGADDKCAAAAGHSPVARPDPDATWTGAFAAELTYRITAIKVWVDGESSEAAPTRRYRFTYAQQPLNNESLLTMVESFDRDNNALRPSTFTYSSASQALASAGQILHFAVGEQRQNGPLRRNTVAAGTRSDLIDMTGDGRPDWVECA